MAMDAVPIDRLRSSLDDLKLRFQAANDPGSPSKAWLVHVHDKGEEKPTIYALADGYDSPSVKSSPSTWQHLGVPAIGRRVPRFRRCVRLNGYERLGPIGEDAARLLDGLPAAIQTRLWHGLPAGTDRRTTDLLAYWVLAVFELGNANVVWSPLRCNRRYPITGDQAKAIFAPESGLPADADWYATLPDFAAASVQAVTILQSWLPDVPKREAEAAADDSGKRPQKKAGRKPSTADKIIEACKLRVDYQREKRSYEDFCIWWNGDKKVGRLTPKVLDAKLTWVTKLMKEVPSRIPEEFTNQLKPLRRVKSVPK